MTDGDLLASASFHATEACTANFGSSIPNTKSDPVMEQTVAGLFNMTAERLR